MPMSLISQRTIRSLALLAIATISALLLANYELATPSAAQGAGAGAPPPPKVTVAAPLKRMVPNEEEYVGRFVAVDAIEVKARVSGYLEGTHFTDGQMVQKGQKLFTIDRRTYEISLDQAKATLRQAQAALELATSELARARDLSVGSTITRQTLDQRVSARHSAEAQVMAQTAAVRQATLDLEFTDLSAPVTGRIGDQRLSVGNFVSSATTAGSTVLATIQTVDPIRIEFNFDEAAYLRFIRSHPNRVAERKVPIRLKLLDEADFGHEGYLDFIDNAMNRSSGTIRGRAELANPNGLFAPGMFARLRVTMAPPAEALLIPDSAVGSEQVRKYVIVASANGDTKLRYVELGGLYDGLRIVRQGLGPDDRVLIDGLMRVRPGMKVDPQQGAIKAAAVDRAPQRVE